LSASVVTVIQARRRSTRLPGKVLFPLGGGTVLSRIVQRVKAAPSAGIVVVATTTDAVDDAIDDLCRRERILCFRGHPTDLLDRHYKVARLLKASLVVKIPSDCPLIDPAVIERVVGFAERRRGWFDYVSNLHPASYPDGNDVEVMSFEALETAWREARRPAEREHTTPFLWDNTERFRIGNVPWETGLDLSMTHRWTLDYPEDYELIRLVCEELDPVDPDFGLAEILGLLERRPELKAVNERYLGVNWYRHHIGELRTISPGQTRHPAPGGEPATPSAVS
jgi:spore coat polysaccharide biosynthesis protein SpsF